METIRIMRYTHAMHDSDRRNTTKKFDAIERMVQANIPGWYLRAGKRLPMLNWFVQIKPVKVDRHRERVNLYFFGKYKDQVDFIYY